MVWTQVYDPLGNPWLSTLCAAIPIIVLLGGLAFFNIAARWARYWSSQCAVHRDRRLWHAYSDGRVPRNGALFGLPIGWIVLNIIFLYQLTKQKGYFRSCRTASRT
jgi:lactate permease